MRDIRLFLDIPLAPGANAALQEKHAHYLRQVMRASLADRIAVFNGRDGEWEAEITALEKRTGTLRIMRQRRAQIHAPDVRLLFAPVKFGRIDYLVEKAAELGVSALQPVFTERTVVTRINMERLRDHCIEAAEQCGRLTVPTLHPAKKLAESLASWPENHLLMLCDETGGGKPVREALAPFASAESRHAWSILTGPEGGFSPSELTMLRGLPYIVPVSMGTRILRADTAALAALACWQALLGDWT